MTLRGNGGASSSIGGNVLSGITLTLKSPLLRGVALLIIFYTTISTVLYIEQADVVAKAFTDRGERTAFFAAIDLSVNCFALLVQIVITRRLVERFGLRVTLAVVPVVVLAGLLITGQWRAPLLLALLQIVHRGGDFSLMRPGREMIYTTVDPESRYKAKNFIDTTVYRANDAAAAWLVAAIRAAGLNAVLLAGVPAAIFWLATGVRLGRRLDRHQPA